ncbi:DctP family TRAP transporter solute-binding subunit [Amphritea pacifica]|uniref:DctP family TRAP transporter solute-binding subunit n=1 Tax=Amphritea pacifica TaxID=2811233 RepID=UPI0019661102|nr:DctP family TRAP transporter solute-binding subunit [Amphritea pacifica]MBN1005104.1 DctP family TRAP transporter solute-binding subunit [Amphritea pacifica]
MKRFLLIAGVVLPLVILFLLLSFGEQQAVNVKADAPRQPAVVLRFGHNTPEDSALHKASLKFAQIVNQKTQGKVVIEVYPAQQLGNDHQMVEMARKGELDIILTPTAKMSVPVPSMQYADLPFLFPSRADAYEMLDGEPGKMLLQDLNSIGLHGVAFWENGFKHFTGNRAFLSPDDFKNTKIRVMKSRIIMEQFRSFGAEPIPIDFHATKQALADGVVDGEENPLIAIYSMGFHEVQSDLVLSNHAFLGYVLSISSKTMNRLPYDVQKVLLDTAIEVTPWERIETQKKEAELIEKIKQAGTRVHLLSEEQRAVFAHKTEKIASQFEGIVGTALISKTEELLFDKYGPPAEDKNHLVIGINADLSRESSSGLAIKRGVQLAVKKINRRGGVLGKKLHMIVLDHKTIPSISIENMEYFIQRPDVVAVVGGKHATIIGEELTRLSRSHIPYLIPWSAAGGLTENGISDNNVFRLSANDLWASEYIANYAIGEYKKPAIVVENTVWGRTNLKNMKRFLFSKGVLPATEVVFNRGETDYSKELIPVFSSGADSVILVANANEARVIIAGLTQREQPLPIISHWGILGGVKDDATLKLYSQAELRFFQTFLFDRSRRKQSRDLKQAYITEYGLEQGEQINSQHAVAQAYDLVQLLALAIERSGSTDRADIVHALEQLPGYEGVVKRYDSAFTDSHHDALGEEDYFMARFGDNGQIIPVN